MRVCALLALTLFVFVGCSQPTSAPEEAENESAERAPEKVSVPADVPDYTLTKDEAAADPALGLRMRSVSASTGATSADDMEAVTRELWSKTQNADALLVAFYPNKPMAELSGTGYAFRDREAARAVLSSQYADPSEANIEEQVEEAMSNGGISVLSLQDEVDAATEEMCAEWDTTTMGTPPPEFNCEDL